jgi:hypothetical protein
MPTQAPLAHQRARACTSVTTRPPTTETNTDLNGNLTMTDYTTVEQNADGLNLSNDLPTILLSLIGACDFIAETLGLLLIEAVSVDTAAPVVGEARGGYVFQGGDSSDPKSWVVR